MPTHDASHPRDTHPQDTRPRSPHPKAPGQDPELELFPTGAQPGPVQVFVTGGVVSSLGKGITAASLGRLLAARGLSVVLQKLDPYLNVDPGTMNPLEHGEVFVTEDGAEVDLDLGHYERFVGRELSGASSVTAGSVYQTVLARERRGGYLGRTVQVIPHITDEICTRVLAVHQPGVDVVITEIGGTVGDIESLPFLEAARQLRSRLGADRVCFVHVTLVPVLTNGELKTKPTQHSVMELRSRGITPDMLVARCSETLGAGIRAKMAEMCGVSPADVIEALDAKILYQVPLAMAAQGLDTRVLHHLRLEAGEAELSAWQEMIERIEHPDASLQVAVVGKYAGPDAYLSVLEALGHAGSVERTQVAVTLVDAETLVAEGVRGEEVPLEVLDEALGSYDAIVVPGGFGERGFEGKIAALRWARENEVPTLGLCLGLQAMVVETARSLCHLPEAHSSELEPGTPHPVVDLLADQRGVTELGGTMRLGSWPAKLEDGTKVAEAYGELVVRERHRHRYEVNPAYRGVLGAAGLVVSGASPDGRLVEYVERDDHPYYVACQAHPELKSRPEVGHPLFLGLIRAARARQLD